MARDLTKAQQDTVAHFQAPNVPATWVIGEPHVDGSVTVAVLGDTFVWKFHIEASGEYAAYEVNFDEDEGWQTGITV